MPRTVTKEVFQYDELSPAAQEKAREWFCGVLDREGGDFAEPVIEEAQTIAGLLGVSIGVKRGRAARDKANPPAIYWTGFYSQGDGACFDGTYGAPIPAASTMLRVNYPDEMGLHKIAEGLDKLQAAWGNTLVARVQQSGHYMHSGCTDIDVSSADGDGGEAPVDDPTERLVIGYLRAFMDWIYRALEAAYEAERADDEVAAAIRANEYEFEADGRRTND